VIRLKTWESIRLRCRRDREPIKAVARDEGIAPNTVRKYLRSDEPPHSNPRRRAHLLDPFQEHIDALLRRSPHITAVRIGRYLRENVDSLLRVDESTLRKYVARRREQLVPKEAFLRACYAPGDEAQFDFSPVQAYIAGVLTVLQLFAIRLSYSGRYFARVSLRSDRVALFTGLLAGFTAFGGLPRRAIFDNAKTAVVKILRGRNRIENEKFTEFCGSLALEIQFAAPAKGNEKGGVEGIVGYLQDNFFTPIPSFESMGDVNVALAAFCERDAERVHSTHHESIAVRFVREQAALRPLPVVLPSPCLRRDARANKFAEVQFENDFYSVPSRFAHRAMVVEAYEDRLRIVLEDAAIAQHPRGFGRGEYFLDPQHYLELLAHKHRAAEHALVLADGRIPSSLHELLARYKAANSATATKRWTQVLAHLAHYPVDVVAQTVMHALARGTDDPEAIALLLRQRTAPAPPALLDPARLPEGARNAAPVVDLGRYALINVAEANA
jgi:transposase